MSLTFSTFMTYTQVRSEGPHFLRNHPLIRHKPVVQIRVTQLDAASLCQHPWRSLHRVTNRLWGTKFGVPAGSTLYLHSKKLSLFPNLQVVSKTSERYGISEFFFEFNLILWIKIFGMSKKRIWLVKKPKLER